MPSNHHSPDDTQTQVHDLLLGFSTFVVLCGIKGLKMMQQEIGIVPKRTRQNWSDAETNELLDCLLKYKAKMAEPFNFTTTTLKQVAKTLDSGRGDSSVNSKFASLKQIYRAIEFWKNSSGRGSWSEEHGANIDDSSPAEVLVWEQYMATSDGREISRFRNTGWPFYAKMRQILGGSPGGAQGRATYTAKAPYEPRSTSRTSRDVEWEEDILGEEDSLMNFEGLDEDLGLMDLMDLAKGFSSPSTQTRVAAAKGATSVFNRLRQATTSVAVSPMATPPMATPPTTTPPLAQHSTFSSDSGSQTFFSESSHPRPPSTHTTVSVANRGSKGKGRARTPALSNQASSIVSSRKRARVTNAESTMANAAAMTSMSGAINRATDCMISFRESSVTSTGPQTTVPTSASTGTSPAILNDVNRYQALALEYLQQDERLDTVNPAIRGDLFWEILANSQFAWAFSQMNDATLRYNVALSWYQKQLQSGIGRSVLPPLSAASSSPFSAPSPSLTAPVSTYSPILLHNSRTHSPALFNNQPTAGSPVYDDNASFPLAISSSGSLISHPASEAMMSTFEDGNHFTQPVDTGHAGGMETNTTYVQEQPVAFEHGNPISGMDSSVNVYEVYNDFPYL